MKFATMVTASLLPLSVGAVAVGVWLTLAQAESAPPFLTATVEEGPLTSTITATGTLSALVTVEVGSQLSGLIDTILVDFNTPVRSGQLLARLNGDQLAARLAQAQADVESAEATLTMQVAQARRAEADLANAEAAAANAAAQTHKAALAAAEARRDLDRREELRGRGVVAAVDLEKAETQARSAQAGQTATEAQERQAAAGIASARAALAVAEAQVAVARSQVAQKRAALDLVKVDIGRAEIRAPIDGVVVDRSVNVGQTVAASLAAPKLFVIAQDLRRMEVLANVNEADIGRVYEGEEVEFTVSAFPDRRFTGKVTQVRLAPKADQNVVTYVVVIAVDNRDLTLLPGMTADLTIVADRRAAVTKLPNAALRFRPPGPRGMATPSPDADTAAAKPPPGYKRVWVPGADGAAVPVDFIPGIGDGSFTEVASGDLKPGRQVIVGLRRDGRSSGGLRLGF